MRVPFQNLGRLHAPLRQELLKAFSDTLENSDFIMGPAVAEFESKFSQVTGSRHALTVNSGTSALYLALLACGVGPGDEVITTPSTFVATTAAVVYTGATPVFVDTNLDSWTIDTSQIHEKVTPRTKAILPVHLHGQMCDVSEIRKIADSYDLKFIEDACQAHLGGQVGARPGELSDAAAFSFYPGKNLGAFGDGGILITQDDDIASRVRLLRNWGSRARYQHELHAFNFRLDSLQAKVLSIKLPHLAHWTQARRQVAARYEERLSDLPLGLPKDLYGSHVFHIYAVRSKARDELSRFLAHADIETSCHYPVPVHLQPAYAFLGYKVGDFPNAEALAQQWLSLPMDPLMTEFEIDYVCDVLQDATSQLSNRI